MDICVRFLKSWKNGEVAPELSSNEAVIIIDDSSLYAFKINSKDEVKEIANQFISDRTRFPFSVVNHGACSYLPNDFYENDESVVLECIHPEGHEKFYFEECGEIVFDSKTFCEKYQVVSTQTF